MEWLKDEFRISTDRAKLDVPYIHAFLSQRSYWAEGIPRAIVEASLAGSECFGVFHGERQIGFARVVTDKATMGYLADVFIDEQYRGQGLSKWLMGVIMGHPELQGFRNWFLGTRDAQGLYAQFGFRALDQPERVMRKRDDEVYKRAAETPAGVPEGRAKEDG
jgi:N-acetylglutamate synthase-like GNAT family acetyltransferase